jgi:ribosomal protein S18 acetylase RimI-like enzyme
VSSDWHLRLARPDDAAAMVALGQEVAVPQDRTEALDEAELRRLIGRRYCLVANVGDALAGFLANEPEKRDLNIRALGVAPAYRQRGIGQGLLRACMIDARNAGFTALTLTARCDAEWKAAFYARLGFERVHNGANREGDASLRCEMVLSLR